MHLARHCNPWRVVRMLFRIVSMDGARIYDITYRNITMVNTITSLYMYIGGRLRRPPAGLPTNDSLVRAHPLQTCVSWAARCFVCMYFLRVPCCACVSSQGHHLHLCDDIPCTDATCYTTCFDTTTFCVGRRHTRHHDRGRACHPRVPQQRQPVEELGDTAFFMPFLKPQKGKGGEREL